MTSSGLSGLGDWVVFSGDLGPPRGRFSLCREVDKLSLFISVWLDLEKYFTGTLSFEWVEWGDLEYY